MVFDIIFTMLDFKNLRFDLFVYRGFETSMFKTNDFSGDRKIANS
jgi:hypothetical protein